MQVHERVFHDLLEESVQREGYITKHENIVCCVAFHPKNNNLVASSGVEGKIKLTARDTGTVRKVWSPNHGQARTLSFSPDDGANIAVGFADGMVIVFDVATGKELSTLAEHIDSVCSVAFSPDGKLLASGDNETMRIWDIATSKMVMGSPYGHGDTVNSVAFSPDGKLVVSGSFDGSVRFWDLATGKEAMAPLLGHTSQVSSIAFSPDGKLVASGGYDHAVRIWDVATGGEATSLVKAHAYRVESVAFSPDGKFLASGSWDRTLKIWDVATWKEAMAPLTGHDDTVSSVAFSADGRFVVSGSQDTTVRTWDVASAKETMASLPDAKTVPFSPGSSGSSVLLSPDGKLFVSWNWNEYTLRIWDVSTGMESMAPLTGHTERVDNVAFSPDCKLLASGSMDETVRIWDVTTGRQAMPPFTGLVGTESWHVSVLFSPNGKLLACSNQHTTRIWVVATGEEAMVVQIGHIGPADSVLFSPDGTFLASGNRDNTVRLWDVSTGKEAMAPLTGHTEHVHLVVFSPDGKLLASVSDDSSVRIWDLATGKEAVPPFIGHRCKIYALAFSPDGKFLSSGTWDDMIRTWDVSTGKEAMAPVKGDKPNWVRVALDISDMQPLAKVNEAYEQDDFRDFLVTALGDQILVYMLQSPGSENEVEEEEVKYYEKIEKARLQGTTHGTLELLAQYTAPQRVSSISCMGKFVCVGLYGDEVG